MSNIRTPSRPQSCRMGLSNEPRNGTRLRKLEAEREEFEKRLIRLEEKAT